jgi:hypothetical protein
MAEKSSVVPVQVNPNSPTLFFEISNVEVRGKDGGWKQVSKGKGARIEEVGQDLSQIVESVKPIATTVVAGFNSMGVEGPTEIELELGVKLSAEVGFFVAKSTGEASLGIKLTWKR